MRRGVPILLATFLIGVCSLHAQNDPQPQRGPDGISRTLMPGIEVYPFPNMPFSGKDNIVWTRTADGGGTITTYLEANVARDSQGRVYRERHNYSPSASVNPQSTLTQFYVLDPIAQTRTICIYAMHHCSITFYRSPISIRERPTGPYGNGRFFLTRESLGNQTIDDLPVLGTRETTSISAGAIGNNQPLAYSRDFWYSPDLKTNLSVMRNDPREGKVDIHLTILSRAEPDPSIFAIPSGFTVEDSRNPAQAAR
jgi:hypothetical protein